MAILLILTIISALLSLLALTGTFASCRWSPIAAWGAMLLCWGEFHTNTLLYWGFTAIIALGINYMLPASISKSRIGIAYMTCGALTVSIVCALLSPWTTVVGAAAGVMLGALAYSRTPAGRILEFPTRKFFNYLCAKGLPIVVNISLIIMVISVIINLYIN